MRPERAQHRVRAAALMLAASLSACAMDAAAKALAAGLPVQQVTFLRYGLALALLLPWLPLVQRPRFGPPAWQLGRGLLLVCDTLCYFGALSLAPFADVVALFNIAPIVVALASPLMLGERVPPRVALAAFVGFGGVLLIVQPGWQVSRGHALALLAGSLYGLYLLGTRRLSFDASPWATQLCTLGLGSLVAAAVAVPTWQPPAAHDWALALAMGACGLLSHVLLTLALSQAKAATVAPWAYGEVGLAAVAGWWLFDEPLRASLLLGLALIVAGGLVSTLHSRPVPSRGR